MAIPKTKTPAASLQQWLIDNNRTQLWLADQLGIKTPGMSKIVHGAHMPRAALALRIQQLTGVTVEALARARAQYTGAAGRRRGRDARIQHGKKLIDRGQAIIAAATADE